MLCGYVVLLVVLLPVPLAAQKTVSDCIGYLYPCAAHEEPLCRSTYGEHQSVDTSVRSAVLLTQLIVLQTPLSTCLDRELQGAHGARASHCVALTHMKQQPTAATIQHHKIVCHAGAVVSNVVATLLMAAQDSGCLGLRFVLVCRAAIYTARNLFRTEHQKRVSM